MAYLNVRERVIETKIAYVGAELSGKATNFEHLCKEGREGRATALAQEPVEGGALLSFEWRPHARTKFNDCNVLVRLMTTHGAVSGDRLKAVLDDADGVVVVVDSDPAAQDRNRRSVEEVRGLLALDAREDRPVLVQMNKRDLPDAVPANELVGALDMQAWPHMTASATLGEGVVETLQRALADVIESVKRTSPDEDWNAPEPTNANGVHAPAAEGNPLLAALRQILREAIAERVSAMEDRVLDRVEQKLLAWSDAMTGILSSKLAKESTVQRQNLSVFGGTLTTVSTAVANLTGPVNTISTALTGLASKLATVEQTTRGLAAESTSTQKDVANLSAEVSTLRRAVTDAADAASAGHEETAIEGKETRDAVQALTKQVEALTAELQKPKKTWFR